MHSHNRKRAPAWTEQEVLELIAVWGDESVLSELHPKRRNAEIFEKISKGMRDRGYNRDPQQCRMKLKELRQAYQRTREANGHSGSEPQICRFYDELHAIPGGAPTTTPALCVDSVNGLLRNRDADFGDEEDDDEEEVDAQQASRETVSPNSQDLFFTLDLVPFQPTEGGLPNIEGREGTSAANVSSHHLSSPSQRLSKIRSRKKCTHDEMLSELMQSSHTERAQHNAWRETMSESRKAHNEREDRRDEREEMRQDAMLRLLEDQTDMLRHMVEVQETQQEHRPPLQPLCNQLPSSPSSIASSPRRPRTWSGGLRAPNHSTPEDCPSNRKLAFNKF
ncbi:uncharacterized protein LOC141978989 [Natator depressus]|uniref:uncharacterized protein LOC141978989 n=1 Tax=Natator depressus TaxID=27790 RepID=UPI003EB70F7F